MSATDEETPLLQSHPQPKTPLPLFQLSIVILLQLAESLTAQVISPFAPQVSWVVAGSTHDQLTTNSAYPGSWCHWWR
jgi:hypothetical protein